MDEKSRLQLNNMLSTNNVLDQTELIRNLKHSHVLRNNVNTLISLMATHMDDETALKMAAIIECEFLCTYYTDIYNKIRKDEIDLKILFEFLNVLQKIEEGKMDQHEGSFEVGTLLKKIYIDSALRKADKLNKDEIVFEPQKPLVDISWRNYKQNTLICQPSPL